MAHVKEFLRRPRYLRAVPSLMLLTTAIAWGVVPKPDMSQQSLIEKASPAVVLGAGNFAGDSLANTRNF